MPEIEHDPVDLELADRVQHLFEVRQALAGPPRHAEKVPAAVEIRPVGHGAGLQLGRGGVAEQIPQRLRPEVQPVGRFGSDRDAVVHDEGVALRIFWNIFLRQLETHRRVFARRRRPAEARHLACELLDDQLLALRDRDRQRVGQGENFLPRGVFLHRGYQHRYAAALEVGESGDLGGQHRRAKRHETESGEKFSHHRFSR